jgi:translocator protein
VRQYLSEPVPRKALERCLEAARLAPSACNSQPWRFIVVDDPKKREELAAAASGGLLPINHFVHMAPVLVAVLATKPKATAGFGALIKRKPFAMMDVGIAAEHFCLQAAEEGLGTCMLGWFNEAQVRTALGVPAEARPVLLLTVGLPAGVPAPRNRKPREEISAWNNYGAELRAVSGWRSFAGLTGWLATCFAAAAIGAGATVHAGSFYAQLVRPVWAPPGWLFGPVWTLLYTLMGISAWLVWKRGGLRFARKALALFLAQLALNALWSWLFFAWRMGAIAFSGALLLAALVYMLQHAFRPYSRIAAKLLVPYLLWTAFAALLAGALWRMNPDLL